MTARPRPRQPLAHPLWTPSSGVIRVDDATTACRLAERLCRGGRERPAAVLTIPAGRPEPYVDAAEVLSAVGDVAEVYVVSPGPAGRALSARLPEGAQVYGGASRVYPVDRGWQDDPERAPLRFAYGPDDGTAATKAVVQDTLTLAYAGGLCSISTAGAAGTASGTVLGVVSGRPLAKLDGALPVTLWSSLLARVDPDRLFAKGMTVTGLLDAEGHRLDVDQMRVPADEALAAYTPGSSVLVRVVRVEPGFGVLELLPDVPVTVDADAEGESTGDLTAVLSAGEVLTARVVRTPAAGKGFVLRLAGTAEPTVPAPALLLGGPSWLLAPQLGGLGDSTGADSPAGDSSPSDESGGAERAERAARKTVETVETDGEGSLAQASDEDAAGKMLTQAPPVEVDSSGAAGADAAPVGCVDDAVAPAFQAADVAPDLPAQVPAQVPDDVTAGPAALLPNQTTSVLQPVPEPSVLDAAVLDAAVLDAAVLDAAVLDAAVLDAAVLDAAVLKLREERHQLLAQLQRAEGLLDRSRRQLESTKTELRLARERAAAADRARAAVEGKLAGRTVVAAERLFPDLLEQLRFDVFVTWAHRTQPGEKIDLPLARWSVGDHFFDSFGEVQGVDAGKVVDVIVDVLTGRAAQLPSRGMHQLREGSGGDARPVVRSDGATCWRVALQQRSASARRLHFWRLNDGSVELSSIRLHDNMEP